MKFGLPKVEIISLKKDIDALLESGQVIFKYPLKVYFLEKGENVSEKAGTRVMFSVPKRNFKRAVMRNLLKRRMREAFRQNKWLLEGKQMDILFVYISKEINEYDFISKTIIRVLEKLRGGAQKNSDISTDSAD